MNQVTELETLKAVKRGARALYGCCRRVYADRLGSAGREEKRVFYEAIGALDAMSGMYEALKMGMRRRSMSEQIVFAAKWDKYISCIDVLTAHRTQDRYLLNTITQDEPDAAQIARTIYLDYTTQLSQQKISANS